MVLAELSVVSTGRRIRYNGVEESTVLVCIQLRVQEKVSFITYPGGSMVGILQLRDPPLIDPPGLYEMWVRAQSLRGARVLGPLTGAPPPYPGGSGAAGAAPPASGPPVRVVAPRVQTSTLDALRSAVTAVGGSAQPEDAPPGSLTEGAPASATQGL